MNTPEMLWFALARTTIGLAASTIIIQLLIWTVRPVSPRTYRIAWACVLISGIAFGRVPINIPATIESVGAAVESPAEPAPLPGSTSVPLPTEPMSVSAPAGFASRLPAPAVQNRIENEISALPATEIVPAFHYSWHQAALVVWGIGVAVMLSVGIFRYVRFASRIARCARAPNESKRQRDYEWQHEWNVVLDRRNSGRRIPLVVSESAGPALCLALSGYRVIVPRPLWELLSAAKRISILRHELAHYERGDLYNSLFALLIVAMHWFNPCAWWARRQFDAAGEWACDDAAARTCNEIEFAKTLMQLAGIRSPAIPLTDAVASGPLYARIRRLLTSSPRRDGPKKRFLVGTVSIAVASLALVRVNRVAVATSPVVTVADAGAATGRVSPTSGKTLHFPPDRTVGTIRWRPARANSSDIYPFGDGWLEFKPARGDVVVPQGQEVWLDIMPATATDLAFLSALAPDAIQALRDNVPKLDVSELHAIARLRGLRRLQLGISVEHLAELGVLPRLEQLNLGPQKGNEPETLVHGIEWITSQPELRILNLLFRKLPDAAIDALPRCRKLETLTVQIGTLQDRDLRALASIPHLRSLDVWRQPLKGELEGTNLTGLAKNAEIAAGFAHFEKLPHLETLRLSNFPVNAAMLRGLAKVKSLRTLELQGVNLAEDAPSAVRELTQIRTLQLPQAVQPGLVRDLVPALASLPELREWPQLYEIDQYMLDLIARAPHVESLDLHSDGKPMSQTSIARLSDLKELRRLKLSTFSLDDKGLASVARLKSLESLDLRWTNVSGDGFRYLKELPKLDFVLLEMRQGVRPRLEGLAELTHLTRLFLAGSDLRPRDFDPLGRMQNLRYLQIRMGLADDTTAARLAGLKHLDSLILIESLLTDRGLQSLSQLKTLKTLAVQGVFTDDGIQRLSTLPHLQFLTLNSDHVTDAGLEKLRKASLALTSARCEHPLHLRGER